METINEIKAKPIPRKASDAARVGLPLSQFYWKKYLPVFLFFAFTLMLAFFFKSNALAIIYFPVSLLTGAFAFTFIRQRNQKIAGNGSQALMPIEEDPRFRTLIKNAPEAVVVLDPSSQLFVDANQHAEALFGYSLDELCYLGPLELSPHSQPSGIASSYMANEMIKEALRGKNTIFEWTHKNKSGETIPCEVQLVRIPANGKRLIRASILDLRTQKKNEAEEERRLKTASRRVDELASLAIASASISSSLEIDKVLEIVSKQLTNLLEAQICLIFYWEGLERGNAPNLVYVNPREGFLPQSHQVRSTFSETTFSAIENGRHAIQFHANEHSNGRYREALSLSGVSSILILPLISKSKMMGVIEIQDTRKRAVFDERDLYLAQTLSQQAANAIENARLFQSTNRQLLELRSLKDLAIASTEASSEVELINTAGQIIRERITADDFGILLLSPDHEELVIYPPNESELTRNYVAFGEGITGTVAKNGEAIRIGNTKSNSHYLDLGSNSNSELCVPINIGKNVIGVINAESQAPDHFSIEDEHLLITFANQLANGIGRIRHENAQKRKGHQLRILNELSSQLAGILDQPRLFETLVQQLHEKMAFLGVYVFSIHQDQSLIKLEAQQGLIPKSDDGRKHEQSISEGLLGKAVRQNECVVSNQVSRDEDYLEIDGVEGVASEIIIPICVYKKANFLLAISSNKTNEFGPDEIAALKTLVDHISVSLEGISLFDATRRQLQELTVIHSIANAAVSSKNERELLERATEVISATLFPDRFGFLMLEENKSSLRIDRSYRGIDEEDRKERLISTSEGIVGRVATTGMPFRIGDVQADSSNTAINPDTRSALAVPLYAKQSVVGVINAESGELDAFSDGDLRLLSTIAGQLGNAIEKLRLFEAEKMQRVQAETLQEVAAILGGAADISKVADLILEELNRVVPFASASIQILEGEDLVISAVGGNLSKDVVGHRLSIKEDKFAHPMLEEQRTVLYEDISNHPDWLVAPGTEYVKSWIGAPLIVRGQCIGVLTVDGHEKNQFSQEDAQLVSAFAIHAGIAIENSRLFKEIEDSYSQTVSALANAIDVRDSYINGHSQRLATLAIETGRILKCEERTLEDIYWAALLHDIGKIGVPDEILNKPSRLTDEEFAIIKQHPAIGERIIEPIKKLAHLGPIIRAHQEKHDGSGYPDKLQGNEIPLAARIISVADAFVAMTDDRVYRKALDVNQALKEIKKCSGTQFDPEVVDAFLEAIRMGDSK